MGNSIKLPKPQRPQQPVVVIPRPQQPVDVRTRPQQPVVVIPRPVAPPVDKNMMIFRSSSPYKRIIESSIYADCLRLKKLLPNINTLSNTELFYEFNKELLRMSSSNLINEFYMDLDNKTPASISKVTRFLMDYLTKVIIKIVHKVISNNTNNIINLSINFPWLNSIMYEAINSTLNSIYESTVNDNSYWNTMNVSNVIDIYIKRISGSELISNIFKIYTGEINFVHIVKFRSTQSGPSYDQKVDLYKMLYDIVSMELQKIENNVRPEVIHVIALKIFFDKNLSKLPRERITGNINYTNYIKNLNQQMLVYVLESLYGTNSTLSSTEGPMLLDEIRKFIDKSKETYEYDEEDDNTSCNTEAGNGLTMYNIHMIFIISLLSILLVLFMMNDKKRSLK